MEVKNGGKIKLMKESHRVCIIPFAHCLHAASHGKALHSLHDTRHLHVHVWLIHHTARHSCALHASAHMVQLLHKVLEVLLLRSHWTHALTHTTH
jgi:hypothetical protein